MVAVAGTLEPVFTIAGEIMLFGAPVPLPAAVLRHSTAPLVAMPHLRIVPERGDVALLGPLAARAGEAHLDESPIRR